MKNEQKSKKKMSFMPTLITFLVLGVASLVSYLVSGDITILDDSVIATVGVSGLVGGGQLGKLLIDKLKARKANPENAQKSKQRTKDLVPARNREEKRAKVDSKDDKYATNESIPFSEVSPLDDVKVVTTKKEEETKKRAK